MRRKVDATEESTVSDQQPVQVLLTLKGLQLREKKRKWLKRGARKCKSGMGGLIIRFIERSRACDGKKRFLWAKLHVLAEKSKNRALREQSL